MFLRNKFVIFFFVLTLSFPLFFHGYVFAQTVTPTPTISVTPTPDNSGEVSDLQNKINDLEKKLQDTRAQEKTLSSQIGVMDSQIKLTELRMNSTETQIKTLTQDIKTADGKINNLEKSLNEITKVLVNRIRATYQVGTNQPIQVLLASKDAGDFMSRVTYLRIVQEHDKKLIYDTQQARNDYQNQKNIFEEKKKKVEALKTQLEQYATQISQEKVAKKRLLTDTQGSESTYQRLLSQAQAQLAGFSRFTSSQVGGASILSGQTVCDDWGCYYNQRDSQWGGLALNGTQYTLASDGCLVTSMAMVYTHMGHKSVTPATINSNSANFASYYPAFLLKTISADGMTASRVASSIDGELSAGRPVIVGISYDSGPLADHFLVLISGSDGNYMMNDPYTPNGHNISFTSKYSVGSIREIEKVVSL